MSSKGPWEVVVQLVNVSFFTLQRAACTSLTQLFIVVITK